MTLTLKIITSSTRPSRQGPKVAAWVEAFARKHGGFSIEAVDLAAMDLPLLDEPAHPAMQKYEHEHTKRWSAVIAGADAFLFVTPEYDFFTPAALVNAIQCLSREWKYKAAGVVSYGGVSGGLRSAQVLRGLLGNVGVMAIPQTVPLPFFSASVNEEGTFEANDKMEEGLKLLLDELAKWSGALKPIRG